MTYRLLQETDLKKGFLELLTQLTKVGDIPKNEFVKRFSEIVSNPMHRIYVLEQGKKIISCATLFLEPKFIHECGITAHVEDVVCHSDFRGQGLGKKIIKFLTNEAERLGCYKIILDCSEKNVGFYEKCNYIKKGAFMAKYLNPNKNKEIIPFYRQALRNVDKFCKNNYRGIIIANMTILAGYYIYKNYYEEMESDDE